MRMKIAWLTGLAAFAMLLTVCAGAQAKRVGIRSFEVESSTSQAGGHPDVHFYVSFDNRNVENGEFAEPEFGTCFCHDVQQADTHFPTGFIGNPPCGPRVHAGRVQQQKMLARHPGGRRRVSGRPAAAHLQRRAPPGPAGAARLPPADPQRAGLHRPARADGSDDGLDATTVQIFHFLPISNLDVHIWGVPASPAHDYNRQPSPQVGYFAEIRVTVPGSEPRRMHRKLHTSRTRHRAESPWRGASISPITTAPFTTPMRPGR